MSLSLFSSFIEKESAHITEGIQHDDTIYVYCERIPTRGSANIYFLIKIQEKEKKEGKEKKILVMRTRRIESLKNLPVYHIAALAPVCMLDITALVLIYLITEVCAFHHLPPISPPPTLHLC